MTERSAESDAPIRHGSPDQPRATVDQALRAWEQNGPTSLTVALMADALYGVRDARVTPPAEGHSSAGAGHDDLTAEEQYRALGRDYPPGGGDPES